MTRSPSRPLVPAPLVRRRGRRTPRSRRPAPHRARRRKRRRVAQVAHHVGVVHDLLAHVHDTLPLRQCPLDDLDRAIHAGAERPRSASRTVLCGRQRSNAPAPRRPVEPWPARGPAHRLQSRGTGSPDSIAVRLTSPLASLSRRPTDVGTRSRRSSPTSKGAAGQSTRWPSVSARCRRPECVPRPTPAASRAPFSDNDGSVVAMGEQVCDRGQLRGRGRLALGSFEAGAAATSSASAYSSAQRRPRPVRRVRRRCSTSIGSAPR